MAERLHIIMPCARWQNIPRIAEHYLWEQRGHGFELRWHICQQGPEPDPKGFRKINEMLDMIEDGWVWAPSDDTLHDPRLFKRLEEVIGWQDFSEPRVGAVVFSEERQGGVILRACPSEMRVGQVDGSQYFLRRDFLADLRFDFENWGNLADGKLIEMLYNFFPNSFYFCDEVLIQFGSLERAWAPETVER